MSKIPTIRLPHPEQVNPELSIRIRETYTVEYDEAEWTVEARGGKWVCYRPKIFFSTSG